jgi:hypothetical protein
MEMLQKKPIFQDGNVSRRKASRVISLTMVIGAIATVAVAALATKGAADFRPDPHAWFLTLVVPGFLVLIVTAYYNEKQPY